MLVCESCREIYELKHGNEEHAAVEMGCARCCGGALHHKHWTCDGCQRTLPKDVARYAGRIDTEDVFCHACFMREFYPHVTHPASPVPCHQCHQMIQPGDTYEVLKTGNICHACFEASTHTKG